MYNSVKYKNLSTVFQTKTNLPFSTTNSILESLPNQLESRTDIMEVIRKENQSLLLMLGMYKGSCDKT